MPKKITGGDSETPSSKEQTKTQPAKKQTKRKSTTSPSKKESVKVSGASDEKNVQRVSQEVAQPEADVRAKDHIPVVGIGASAGGL